MSKILNIPMSLAVLVMSLLAIVAFTVASPFIAVIYLPCKIIYKFFGFLSEGPCYILGFIEGLLTGFLED